MTELSKQCPFVPSQETPPHSYRKGISSVGRVGSSILRTYEEGGVVGIENFSPVAPNGESALDYACSLGHQAIELATKETTDVYAQIRNLSKIAQKALTLRRGWGLAVGVDASQHAIARLQENGWDWQDPSFLRKEETSSEFASQDPLVLRNAREVVQGFFYENTHLREKQIETEDIWKLLYVSFKMGRFGVAGYKVEELLYTLRQEIAQENDVALKEKLSEKYRNVFIRLPFKQQHNKMYKPGALEEQGFKSFSELCQELEKIIATSPSVNLVRFGDLADNFRAASFPLYDVLNEQRRISSDAPKEKLEEMLFCPSDPEELPSRTRGTPIRTIYSDALRSFAETLDFTRQEGFSVTSDTSGNLIWPEVASFAYYDKVHGIDSEDGITLQQIYDAEITTAKDPEKMKEYIKRRNMFGGKCPIQEKVLLPDEMKRTFIAFEKHIQQEHGVDMRLVDERSVLNSPKMWFALVADALIHHGILEEE